MNIQDWPRRLRHIRDLWNVAGERLSDNKLNRLASVFTGDVLIFRRQYLVQGSMTEVAGHMAIVSVTADRDKMPQVVHTYPRTGRVEERPLKTLSTLMGRLVLPDLLQCVQNNSDGCSVAV